jgi:hypothetical protein
MIYIFWFFIQKYNPLKKKIAPFEIFLHGDNIFFKIIFSKKVFSQEVWNFYFLFLKKSHNPKNNFNIVRVWTCWYGSEHLVGGPFTLANNILL